MRHRADHSAEAIVAALRAHGYTVSVIGRPVDLMLYHASWGANRFRCLEVKTAKPNGKIKVRKDQVAQNLFIGKTGVPRVSNIEEAIEALK